jgi:hypothetical protein
VQILYARNRFISQMYAVSIPPTAIKIDVILREYFTKNPELAITSENTAITSLTVADDERSRCESDIPETKTKPNAATPRAIGIRQRTFAGRS